MLEQLYNHLPSQVDLMLILLSEGLPFLCALRSFLLRRGFWHGYMQGRTGFEKISDRGARGKGA